jgi:hypothetical protein
VVDCAGTGVNVCEFRWRSGEDCLRVFTTGEYFLERGSPLVDRFSVELCAKLHDN